jgi:hypothetical protein
MLRKLNRKKDRGHLEAVKLVAKFVMHLIIGVLLFLVVGAVAVLLQHLGAVIGNYGAPEYVTLPMEALEMLLFGFDLLCAALFVVIQGILFIKDLIRFFKASVEAVEGAS